jgi:hypothetical protein
VDRLAAKGGLLSRRRVLPSVAGASCLRGRADPVPVRWRERRLAPWPVEGETRSIRPRPPADVPRSFVSGNQPVPPPTETQEPGPRQARRRIARRRRSRVSKAIEPARRGARVDADERQVLARIREHVDQRVPHHAGRRECERVVAVRPQRTAAPERTIDAERAADREAAHAATERGGVACLDDEVHVVALHREVHDAEVWSGGSGQRRDDRPTRVP